MEFHITQKRHKTAQIKEMYEGYLEKRAKLLLPKMTKQLSKQIGITPTRINIKSLKDRWGSSTSTGEVNLNSNLIKAPRNVIKYVILHELCHFKIKEHSPRFWDLIAQHMSKYEESMEWLEANGIKIT